MVWPPRSSDLIPLDVFILGHVINIVFSEKIQDSDHLRRRIAAYVASVTPDILHSAWTNIDYRLDVRRVTNSAYLEILSLKKLHLIIFQSTSKFIFLPAVVIHINFFEICPNFLDECILSTLKKTFQIRYNSMVFKFKIY